MEFSALSENVKPCAEFVEAFIADTIRRFFNGIHTGRPPQPPTGPFAGRNVTEHVYFDKLSQTATGAAIYVG